MSTKSEKEFMAIVKVACCLNCVVPDGSYIYCDKFITLLKENTPFDETGETQACIHYLRSCGV